MVYYITGRSSAASVPTDVSICKVLVVKVMCSSCASPRTARGFEGGIPSSRNWDGLDQSGMILKTALEEPQRTERSQRDSVKENQAFT
jgi:hypothetical protein